MKLSSFVCGYCFSSHTRERTSGCCKGGSRKAPGIRRRRSGKLPRLSKRPGAWGPGSARMQVVHSRRKVGSAAGQRPEWGCLAASVSALFPPNTKASSIWTGLTSKIWPQTDIISRQHPVQNLVNHSFICTIFAETEKSSVNATLLLREQTTKNTPGINMPGPSLLLYPSLPAPLPPHSESARSAAVTQTLFPLPPSAFI